MSPTTFTTSPQFDQAAVNAIGSLWAARTQLTRMRTDAHEVEDEHELMHLCSLALLADQRGRHFVDDCPEEAGGEHTHCQDLVGLLNSSHDQLIAQTSGLEPLNVLEFVNEVGALCRGVRRYVHRH